MSRRKVIFLLLSLFFFVMGGNLTAFVYVVVALVAIDSLVNLKGDDDEY